MVYANINSSEEDFSFILTALYHWEKLYPTFTLELPKDPEDIVVKKPKQPSKEEEVKKVDTEVKEKEKEVDEGEKELLLEALSE